MRLSRTISYKFALIGVVLTLIAGLIALALIARNRPEKLFARFVVTPIPKSVLFWIATLCMEENGVLSFTSIFRRKIF